MGIVRRHGTADIRDDRHYCKEKCIIIIVVKKKVHKSSKVLKDILSRIFIHYNT